MSCMSCAGAVRSTCYRAGPERGHTEFERILSVWFVCWLFCFVVSGREWKCARMQVCVYVGCVGDGSSEVSINPDKPKMRMKRFCDLERIKGTYLSIEWPVY
jgi:hypothetical protein